MLLTVSDLESKQPTQVVLQSMAAGCSVYVRLNTALCMHLAATTWLELKVERSVELNSMATFLMHSWGAALSTQPDNEKALICTLFEV